MPEWQTGCNRPEDEPEWHDWLLAGKSSCFGEKGW